MIFVNRIVDDCLFYLNRILCNCFLQRIIFASEGVMLFPISHTRSSFCLVAWKRGSTAAGNNRLIQIDMIDGIVSSGGL